MSKTFKEKILKDFKSTSKLQECFDTIGYDKEKLMIFLHNFVEYNMPFAAGVTGLVTNLHLSKNFIKKDYDASADIASYIFAAAEDEYFDRDSLERITHKKLAQDFRKYCSKILDTDYKKLETIDVSKKITYGYFGKTYDIAGCIGFHIGSEVLASEEFNQIHKYLVKNWPNLVSDLKDIKIYQNKNAYCWLKIHTYFEEEHANLGFKAYEMAKNFWTKKNFETFAYEGVKDFARIQNDCFDKILKLL